MKILIIGGTGNISTGITRILLERGGYDVTLFNNDKDDAWGGRTKRIVGNRHERAAFEDAIRSAGPWDCVLDMICFDPEDARSDIRAVGGRTKQFIFTSTVDAFTKGKAYPVPVDYERNPDPAFVYGYNKAQAEFAFEEAANKGDFALTIIRPVATYNDSWLPLSFIAQAPGYVMRRIRDGKPMIMHGDGTSLWPSTHRDDVAVAFANAIGNAKAYGRMYVTSPDQVHTWNDYYQTVARVMGAPRVTFVNIPSVLLSRMMKHCDWVNYNFQYSNVFDNTPAKQDLGFRYTITWEEGVRRCLAHPACQAQLNSTADWPFYDKIIDEWKKHEDAMIATCKGWGL